MRAGTVWLYNNQRPGELLFVLEVVLFSNLFDGLEQLLTHALASTKFQKSRNNFSVTCPQLPCVASSSTGRIRPQLGDLGALKYLHLSNNNLDGELDRSKCVLLSCELWTCLNPAYAYTGYMPFLKM